MTETQPTLSPQQLARPRVISWLVRLGPCLLLAIVCFLRKEWYPFSHFPMYATLGGDRWVIEITDPEGNLVPARKRLGIQASKIKKIVDSNLLKLRKKYGTKKTGLPRAAWNEGGQITLDWLAEEVKHSRPNEPIGPWQLWKKDFNYNGEKQIVSQRLLLATLTADGRAVPAPVSEAPPESK